MRVLKIFVIFIFFSFILHLVWETLHLPLYGGYEGLGHGLPITLWATLGDVAYTLGVIIIVGIFKVKLDWLVESCRRDFMMLAAFGFVIAMAVEYKALFFSRWHYQEAMPIIPWLQVGLSPVLQMAILLPLAAYLTKKASIWLFYGDSFQKT